MPEMTAEQFVDHLVNCGPQRPQALLMCDTGVNADDTIAKMLASGEWELSPDVEYIAGKRIQHLVKVGVRDAG